MKNNKSSTSLASGIKRVFFAAIIILSMSTSFLYFVAVFSFGVGLVSDNITSVLLNGTIGILVTDVGALAWLKIYLGASDNNDLRNLAQIGAGVGVIGSTVASLAYLLLIAGDGYAVNADLGTYTQWALAVIIVIHFLLVFLSAYKSTGAKIDERRAELIADATEEMLKLTEKEFSKNIPSLAKQNAAILTREMAGQFSNLTGHDSIVNPTPARHSENGQEKR